MVQRLDKIIGITDQNISNVAEGGYGALIKQVTDGQDLTNSDLTILTGMSQNNIPLFELIFVRALFSQKINLNNIKKLGEEANKTSGGREFLQADAKHMIAELIELEKSVGYLKDPKLAQATCEILLPYAQPSPSSSNENKQSIIEKCSALNPAIVSKDTPLQDVVIRNLIVEVAERYAHKENAINIGNQSFPNIVKTIFTRVVDTKKAERSAREDMKKFMGLNPANSINSDELLSIETEKALVLSGLIVCAKYTSKTIATDIKKIMRCFDSKSFRSYTDKDATQEQKNKALDSMVKKYLEELNTAPYCYYSKLTSEQYLKVNIANNLAPIAQVVTQAPDECELPTEASNPAAHLLMGLLEDSTHLG
jgi:hypothetical protein